ncbi:MAG: tetratricopeptide repeat protein [Deltaproteobacteria bacterium]|nr:tetratricopeptide repeat protein [Deltaproteobacteria bacterium]
MLPQNIAASPLSETDGFVCHGCGLTHIATRRSCLLCGIARDSSGAHPLPLNAPLLERARETSAIDGAVDRFLKSREGGIVAVVASPSMGRTRLLRHAVERLMGQSDVRILASTAREGDTAFATVGRWLLDRFQISATRPIAAARMDVGSEAHRVLSRRGVVSQDMVRRLLALAGLGNDETGQLSLGVAELGEALSKFFIADAELSPLVLIIDRFERVSDDVRTLLREMAGTFARSPILLLLATTADRLGPLRAKARVVVEPEPLSTSACEILCHHLLPGLAVVPDELLEAVVTRAAGAPGRVRELLLALIEANVVLVNEDPWGIDLDALGPNGPISSADLLHIRVSRLDESERTTLERAAVVGEVFWEGTVCALARHEDGALDPTTDDLAAVREHENLKRLTAAELIAPIENRELANEREFVFSVAGLRELLLNAQDAQVRVRRHEICAGWLELAAGSRADDLARAIAGHLERAGQFESAGRVYLRAARVARAGYRGKQAVQLYDKALEFLPRFNVPSRLEVLHDRGVVLSLLGRVDEAEQTFQEMLTIAYAYGARNKLAAALGRLGRLARGRADFEMARAYLWKALELFQIAEDLRGVAAVQDDLGMVAYLAGDFDTALAHSTQALDLRRGQEDPLGEALSTHNLGLVHLSRGQPRQARAYFERALALRETNNDIEGQFATRNVLAALAFERGEVEQAEGMWREILELADALGDRRMIAFTSANLGESAVYRGDPETALAMLNRAEQVSLEIGDRRVLAEVERVRASLARLMGELDAARARLENALAIAQSLGLRETEALVLRGLGEVFAATVFDTTGESARRADHYFLEAIGVLESLGATRELARTRASFGMCLVETGRHHDARVQLSMAVPVLERLELFDAPPARRALNTLGGELPAADLSGGL